MMYYDEILEKIADAVGDAGEVRSVNEPQRSLYTIFISFLYPWSDPIGIEDYYRRISELVGLDGDGRVRLTVEQSNSEPGKLHAKITVVYKTVYKSKRELQ